MKFVQSVAGTFHHFDVAQELLRRDMLERVYSTYPWRRLQREGIPHDKVGTFPYIAVPEILARRMHLPMTTVQAMAVQNAAWFDRWVSKRIEQCDVLFAISGVGLRTGPVVQQRGGIYICDRGSAHIRVQDNILREEFARWKSARPTVHPATIAREEAEYAEADAITVPSSFARRSFLEMGVPPEKVLRIPYGVRLDRFYPDGEPPAGEFNVLFAGGVTLQKGILYVLDAFRKFRHPNKRLRIAGAVDRSIDQLLAAHTSPGVEFLGSVPQPTLRKLMSESNCLVLASVQEGLAMVQGQALACGCPVIATTNTGGEDLFTDGEEGFIVPIRSVDAIRHKLEWMADNPLPAQEMRIAARARVGHIGGWSDYGDALVSHAARLLAAKRES